MEDIGTQLHNKNDEKRLGYMLQNSISGILLEGPEGDTYTYIHIYMYIYM